MEIRPLSQATALVVTKEQAEFDAIKKIYGNKFGLVELNRCKSTLDAIQDLMENSHDFCFFSEEFKPEQMREFNRDFQKLELQRKCSIFVFVKRLKVDFPLESYRKYGVEGVLSLEGNLQDLEVFMQAVESKVEEDKLLQKLAPVRAAIETLLTQLDQASKDIRRGRRPRVSKVLATFLATQVEDPEVEEHYLDELLKFVESAEPGELYELQLPEEVLLRGLPELVNGNYTGASERLWSKLISRYGKKSSSPRSFAGRVELKESAPEDNVDESEEKPLPDSEH